MGDQGELPSEVQTGRKLPLQERHEALSPEDRVPLSGAGGRVSNSVKGPREDPGRLEKE